MSTPTSTPHPVRSAPTTRVGSSTTSTTCRRTRGAPARAAGRTRRSTGIAETTTATEEGTTGETATGGLIVEAGTGTGRGTEIRTGGSGAAAAAGGAAIGRVGTAGTRATGGEGRATAERGPPPPQTRAEAGMTRSARGIDDEMAEHHTTKTSHVTLEDEIFRSHKRQDSAFFWLGALAAVPFACFRSSPTIFIPALPVVVVAVSSFCCREGWARATAVVLGCCCVRG